MALTWTATLKDDVSAPAKKAAEGVDAMGASAKKADADFAAATKEADAYAKALQKVSDAAVKEAKAQEKTNKDSEDYFKSNATRLDANTKATGDLSDASKADTVSQAAQAVAIVAVANAAKDAIVCVAKLEIGLGELIYTANKSKEDAIKGFEAVEGSASKAKATYDQAAKTSLQIGANLGETMSTMNNLLSQGFKANVADEIVKAMADIKVMDPAADVTAIADALDKVHSQGGLATKTIKSIALAAHTTIPDIESALEQNLHKTKSEIDQMLKKGTITADEGTQAVLDAVAKKTGKPLGGLAQEKADTTLDGAIERAKNLKDQMLANANVDWSPLTATIKKVTDAMSGEAGQKFMKSAVDGINLVISAFGRLRSDDISTMFTVAGAVIKGVADVLWFVVVAAETVAHQFTQVGDAISDAGSAISNFFSSIGSWFSGGKATASAGGSEIGGSIIDGIVSGIEAGAGRAITAIENVGKSLVGAGKDSVHSKSPSKDFMDIGEDISKGQELGIIKGSPMVRKAVTSMVDVKAANGTALETKPTLSTGSREAFKAGRDIRNNATSNSTRSYTPNVTIHNESADGHTTMKQVEDTLRSLNNVFS